MISIDMAETWVRWIGGEVLLFQTWMMLLFAGSFISAGPRPPRGRGAPGQQPDNE